MCKKNPWQQWFVANHYCAAGRPKLEDALMNYARMVFEHTLVYEQDLSDMVKHLKTKHDKLRAENKRWASVEISITPAREGDTLVWLHIGKQNLTLQKVKYVHEGIDPNNAYNENASSFQQ